MEHVLPRDRHAHEPTAEHQPEETQEHVRPEEVQPPDPAQAERPVRDPVRVGDDRERLRPLRQPPRDLLGFSLHDHQHGDAGGGEPVEAAGHLAEVGDALDSDEVPQEDDE